MNTKLTVDTLGPITGNESIGARLTPVGAAAAVWLQLQLDNPDAGKDLRAQYSIFDGQAIHGPTQFNSDGAYIDIPEGGWAVIHTWVHREGHHPEDEACDRVSQRDQSADGDPFFCAFDFTASTNTAIAISVVAQAVEGIQVARDTVPGRITLLQLSRDAHLSVTTNNSTFSFQYGLTPDGEFVAIPHNQPLSVPAQQTLYFRAVKPDGTPSTYAEVQNPTMQQATLLFGFGAPGVRPSGGDTQVTMELKENNLGGGFGL